MKVSELEALILSEVESSLGVEIESHCAVGHTRWATHGPPNTKNSPGLTNQPSIFQNQVRFSYKI